MQHLWVRDRKRLSRLQNGLTVVTEVIPHVETVCLGIGIKRGSRHEAEGELGLCHFMEHALFKGSPRMNAREIAEAFDDMGSNVDAYTMKEETNFSFKVRNKHLWPALDLLCHMVAEPAFDESEMTREKQVILEEIKMDDDSPEELVFEHCMQQFWQGNSMAHSILGTAELVQGFSQEQIAAFHARHYRPSAMIVSAAGHFDPDALLARLAGWLDDRPADDPTFVPPSAPRPHAFRKLLPNPRLEQVNFCVNFPGESMQSRDRWAQTLLNTLFGGGMSSRLFQKIREEHGLVYNIGTLTGGYSDCAHFTIYGGCGSGQFRQVMDLCQAEIERLKQEGVGEVELRRAKEQFAGGLVSGLESTHVRVSALNKHAMYFGRLYDPEQVVTNIEAVTTDEVHRLAVRLFDPGLMGIVATGDLKSLGNL